MVEPAKPATSMRSLERAIDILEVMDSSQHTLRLTEVARRAGLPIATTQRILGVLEARGRVEKDDSGYRAGAGLLFGAHAYLTTSPLLAAAQPVLQDLAAATGLTASLFKRIGWSRVVLARVGGATPLRYELPIGERLPLHLGAGKALTAQMDRAELDDFLAHLEKNSVTVDREPFVAELQTIRERGYSEARGEREPGMASVATPVTDRGGAAAAVQVTGTFADLPEDRVPDLGVELQRAALAISRRIA